jgi:hypothetical protein
VLGIEFDNVETVDGSMESIYNDGRHVDTLLGSVESVVVCLR